jgi:nucleoside diphosphate kinase
MTPTEQTSMSPNPLRLHVQVCKAGRGDGLGVLMFKPRYPPDVVREFQAYCFEERLKIVVSREVHLSRDAVIALYPDVFKFSRSDLVFGLCWKHQTIEYLTSGSCACFLVKGHGAIQRLSQYKKSVRRRFGKMQTPIKQLSQQDFFERVVQNMVHSVDEDEMQNAIWVLF